MDERELTLAKHVQCFNYSDNSPHVLQQGGKLSVHTQGDGQVHNECSVYFSVRLFHSCVTQCPGVITTD